VHSEDRCYFNVYLTEQGKKHGEQVVPIIEQINRQICKEISKDELNELRSVFAKIRSNINPLLYEQKVSDTYEK
jgi:MarR family transcriptional regulator, organic hydroperoxide resistance regulator